MIAVIAGYRPAGIYASYKTCKRSDQQHFERMLVGQYMQGKSEQEIASILELKNAWMAKNYKKPSRFSLQQSEACMLLLADYSAKAVGVNTNVKDGELLKEMVGKLELVLG